MKPLTRREFTALSGAVLLSPRSVRTAEPTEFRVKFSVNSSPDLGQNLGSLFEISDSQGRPIMGAGFLGAYNTYYRNDHRLLHVFVRPPDGTAEYEFKKLQRPSENCGLYLFEENGQVRADTRGSLAHHPYWSHKSQQWQPKPSIQSPGDGLHFSRNIVTHDGEQIYELPNDQGVSGSYYYAHGFLFVWITKFEGEKRKSRLIAYPWRPDSGQSIDLKDGLPLPLDNPGVLPYSYGQLNQSVLVGTNTGGVYEFNSEEKKWKIHRKPVPGVSYQVYSMVNYYDKLLLGHYPTGELFEFDGDTIEHLPGWPPRPKQVSRHAREAQTITLYRGDLYVGVWPWGELWRYDKGNEKWDLTKRMFTHPPMQDDIVEPYSRQMQELFPGSRQYPYNHWGQRVTSLVPHADSLLISTSNKGATPFDPVFKFLSKETSREYGAFYQMNVPGHLTVPIRWSESGENLEFGIKSGVLSIRRSGASIASIPVNLNDFKFGTLKIDFGRGVFGATRASISSVRATHLELHG